MNELVYDKCLRMIKPLGVKDESRRNSTR